MAYNAESRDALSLEESVSVEFNTSTCDLIIKRNSDIYPENTISELQKTPNTDRKVL